MLGGRISTQDEEEVEDELAALEQEMSGETEGNLPQVPNSKLPQQQQHIEEPAAVESNQRQAMLAS